MDLVDTEAGEDMVDSMVGMLDSMVGMVGMVDSITGMMAMVHFFSTLG